MALQRWMQTPGIDLLGFQFTHTDRAKNGMWLLTIKEVTSVAHQLGRSRVLCEAYGGGGYGMGPREFKPLSDYLLVHDVNLINPHLSHETLSGARKYDWAHTISDHAPWWDCYKELAEHDGRLNVAISQGKIVNRVLLLHPTESAWMYYAPQSHRTKSGSGHPALDTLKTSQVKLVELLAGRQVDFDLGDEAIMAELGKVDGHRLQVGHATYDVVVVPETMTTVRPSTVRLLDQFAQAGGAVVMQNDAAQLVNARPWSAAQPGDEGVPSRAEVLARWKKAESDAALLAAIHAVAPAQITSPDGGPLPEALCVMRRELKNGQFVYVFVNPWNEPLETKVLVPGQTALALDTFTGTASGLPTTPGHGGQVFALNLPAQGHAVVVTGASASAPAAPAKIAEALPLEEIQISIPPQLHRSSGAGGFGVYRDLSSAG
jgi:hypothetical protein